MDLLEFYRRSGKLGSVGDSYCGCQQIRESALTRDVWAEVVLADRADEQELAGDFAGGSAA